MLNIAIVGLGNMGRLHIKNVALMEQTGLCRLSCVCDIKSELADSISGELKIPGYSLIEDLIENESIDAAIVATTSASHYMITKKLIEKHIPVLVEKPVVLNVKDAERLKNLSEKNGVLISAGFTEIYNSVTTGVKSILSNKNDFDYLDFFRIGQKSSKNDMKDIDVVHDLMIHDIAVLSQLIDLKRIKDVSGYFTSYNEHSSKYDLSSVCLLLDNGRIVRFFSDRNGTTKIRRFTLSKEDMYGEFDYMDQTAQVFKKGQLEAFGDNIWYSQNYDASKIRYSNNPLYDEIKDFICAILNSSETKASTYWYEITLTVERIRAILYDNVKM